MPNKPTKVFYESTPYPGSKISGFSQMCKADQGKSLSELFGMLLERIPEKATIGYIKWQVDGDRINARVTIYSDWG